MKHEIYGEITTKTFEELAEEKFGIAHDVTCHVPTAESARQHAEIIMHLAADMYDSAAQFVRKSRTAVSAPVCPRCGSNRQVWKNQLNGKMMCHRVGCYIVLHNIRREPPCG